MEQNVSTNHLIPYPMAILSEDQVTLKVSPCTESVNASTESANQLVQSPAEQIQPQQKKIGRPVSITEAYRYILARDGALKFAEVIARDAVEAKNARDRLGAAQEIEDRVSGKATQRIDTRGVFVVLAPEAGNLVELDQWADE